MWVPPSLVCSPTVNLQKTSFLREPLGPRAGVGPGPVASQVASIRYRPVQDSRAANPKVYGAVPLAKAQECKKQKWNFQILQSFSFLFLLHPIPRAFLFIPCFCLSHPLNLTVSKSWNSALSWASGLSDCLPPLPLQLSPSQSFAPFSLSIFTETFSVWSFGWSVEYEVWS